MSYTRSKKRNRADRSRSPSPEDRKIKVIIIVNSEIRSVETDTDPVVDDLLPTTTWEQLKATFDDATSSRVTSVPESWCDFALELSILVGSDEMKVSFWNTKGYRLSQYPRDNNNEVVCEIGVLRKWEQGIVLSVDTDDATSSATSSGTGVAAAQPQARRSQSNRKRITLEIRFPELFGNVPKIESTTAPSNATFDKLTDIFDYKVKSAIGPRYLACLVRWGSKIGTEEDGFSPAQDGKLLSDYPGSQGEVMVAKVSAGLIRPTLLNIEHTEPEMLTAIPSVTMFNSWMEKLVDKARRPLERKDTITGEPIEKRYEHQQSMRDSDLNGESKMLESRRAKFFAWKFNEIVERAKESRSCKKTGGN